MDLVALVPGKDDRELLDGLLDKRRDSLGIRQIEYQILTHPGHDPGCYHKATDLLHLFRNRAKFALVMFDHRGSGQEDRPPEELERDLETRLAEAGWGSRAAVFVLRPDARSLGLV